LTGVITPDLYREIKRLSQYWYGTCGYAMHPYDADDLAQELCLKIVEKYDGARDIMNFVKFYGRRIVSDLYRTLHGRYANAKYEEIDERECFEDEIDKANIRLSLESLTKHSKPRDKEVIYRYFVGGETNKELAERYGVSPGAISQIIHNTYNGGWFT
jgi:RNA polymerase sigma factor (sigma-70 family)